MLSSTHGQTDGRHGGGTNHRLIGGGTNHRLITLSGLGIKHGKNFETKIS